MRSSTKVEKMPTPNTKVFAVSDDPPRGRLPSAEKPGRSMPTEVSTTNLFFTRAVLISSYQLPRSRSKSRYVLDKINGLFSGRRDRRTVELPPVPPVKDNFLATASKEVRVNSVGSPVVTGSLAPPLTKMPTIPPPVDSIHPALRNAPSSSSVAPSAATIGSDADYEGRRSLQFLSEKLLGRAVKEGDPARKERLLNFAKVSTPETTVAMALIPKLTLRRFLMILSSALVKRKSQPRQLPLVSVQVTPTHPYKRQTANKLSP